MVLVVVGESSLVWRRGLQTVCCFSATYSIQIGHVASSQPQGSDLEALEMGMRLLSRLVILPHSQFRDSNLEAWEWGQSLSDV